MSNKLNDAYLAQKHTAAKRGIAWDLTKETWLEFWEKSGHLANRGRGKGKYVMSRKGDTGPYSLDNIDIISQEENQRQRVLNGKNTLGADNGMYGKPSPNRKSVINLDTNEVFTSLAEAAQAVGSTAANICSVCKGNLNTTSGYRWAYYTSLK